MAAPSLEERVAELEASIDQIRQEREPSKMSSAPRGWQRIVGIFQDEPEFEEAVRSGREWRMANAPSEAESAA